MEREFLEEMEYVGDIPEGWKWVKLGELLNSGLCELLDRYRIPLSDNQRNKMKDGILYPYYGANGIIDYVNSYIFDGEFILVAEDGTVSTDKGKAVVQYVCGKFWVSNHAHIIKCENSITLKFLYYALRNVDIIPYITGAVQPKLNQRNLLDIEILYALDIPEQKAIAEVLSSIDDKIELLHRQNKTLEEMAMTLFRQWFIEPAKDGLPEGWKMGHLADEFDITMGQSPPGETLNEEKIGMVFFQGGSDFRLRFPVPRVYTTAPTRIAKPLDTLVSVRAPVGDINMAFEECCIGRGVAAFRYKQNPEFYSYTYYKMRSLTKQIKLFEDNGTVFGSIGKDNFKKLDCFIPPIEMILKFEEKAKPFDDKIISNTKKIRTLEKLRDTLLPKLMTGEVRVEF
jgi:type I restriction enzyme S subunit